jgi:hypothetical protein
MKIQPKTSSMRRSIPWGISLVVFIISPFSIFESFCFLTPSGYMEGDRVSYLEGVNQSVNSHPFPGKPHNHQIHDQRDREQEFVIYARIAGYSDSIEEEENHGNNNIDPAV